MTRLLRFNNVTLVVSYYLLWYVTIRANSLASPIMAVIFCGLFAVCLCIYTRYLGLLDKKCRLFILVYCLLGPSIDLECQQLGFISFTAGNPLYLLPLWPVFALLVYFPLRPLFYYPITGAVLACVGFPLTYYFGAYFGAATIHTPFYFLFFGLIWAVMFPTINGIFQDEYLSQRA